uniref:ribosomal protein L33 n=1 Tax=Atrichum angustatum TaxID=37310 RepID=UPI001D1629DB|nr:ribosomal protein L33 [Atrichum angustatum]QZJ47280.1 ribosomal protein L33 [Atrichum angustatum]
MAKNKDIRVTITLECINCVQNDKKKLGVSRYITQKNRRNTPIRLELKKFCSYCNKHTIHKEIKK